MSDHGSNVPAMDDPRIQEARALRIDPGLSRAQLMKHFGVGNGTLTRWLRGIEPPGWTRRPNAKDDVRDRAVDLRRRGWSMPELAAEFGVSKSTVYLWTKDVPQDLDDGRARERRLRQARERTDARWAAHRESRDAERAQVHADAAAGVGALTDREVLLLGSVAYWCEGAKAKPWRQRWELQFINSDPVLIELFLRFVELQGVDRAGLRYRISIHRSADAEAAGRWWAEEVGVPFEAFQRPTLKKHNPATVRRNVGDAYRGCLVIYVPRSSRLYWKVEGVVRAIAVAGAPGAQVRM